MSHDILQNFATEPGGDIVIDELQNIISLVFNYMGQDGYLTRVWGTTIKVNTRKLTLTSTQPHPWMMVQGRTLCSTPRPASLTRPNHGNYCWLYL